MSPDVPRIALAAADGPRLKLIQSLQFKLGLLFVLVAVSLSIGGWWIGRLLVQDNLVADTRRYQRESGLRLAQEISSRMDRAEMLAATVASLVPGGDAKTWNERIPHLAEGSGLGSLVAAVGIWPEPKLIDPARERASVLWLADSAGVLKEREDYNDPRAIPYWSEAWYTPARYAPKGTCYWTEMFTELLSKREVVGCSLPLRDERGFVGVVSVLLDVGALDAVFRQAAAGQSGYALLADRDNRLLAISGAVAEKIKDRPRNLAALAQKLPSFNTLALDLHGRDESFLSHAVQSPLYDAAAISALKDATRDGSRSDAESALALIWTAGRPDPSDGKLDELLIDGDAILGEEAAATVFELPRPFWKLVRVTRAREGVAGAEYFFTQTLVVVCGAVLLILVLVFAGMRFLVLRPLTAMATRLSDARSLEESLHVQLDSSARNEIGLIGHWYNERVRQLREAMDRTATQQAQLVVESAERIRLDDQSVRARERAVALLGTVSDGIIVIDAKGIVDDLNAPAEQILAVQARNVRGKHLDEVFRMRLNGAEGPQADLATTVLAATSRIDHSEGVHLLMEGRPERDIMLSMVPLRSPGGRSLGAVFVFRLRETVGAATKLVIDRRSVDSVTGLPTRAACDRRLRNLQETARLQQRTHAIIVADIDRLRQVNNAAGARAGDEMLVRVAERLVAGSSSGEVFRLGADTFAIVLEDCKGDTAVRVAESMRENIATARFGWEDRALMVTVSFGIVGFGGGEEHPVELLRRAEEACSASKRSGRNAVTLYDPSLDSLDEKDASIWVRRIKAGMNEGLFHLTTQWIQPSGAHAAEGAVFDVSLALEDEEGFWAEPAAFMPVAERAGLAADVERWAIRHTLEHLARNPDVVARLAFCTLTLSGPTISDGNTLELLAQTFQQHENLPPGRICFMLRDSTLEDAPGAAASFCDAMRSLGCRVAIDYGIGRGASGLDLFRKLPAEYLRIDARHFVDLGGDAVDQIIAESLLKLGRTLHRRVMVTDIGDEGTRDTWRRMGADYLHGLSVARPSPVVFAANG